MKKAKKPAATGKKKPVKTARRGKSRHCPHCLMNPVRDVFIHMWGCPLKGGPGTGR